jgi:hypothetical protein
VFIDETWASTNMARRYGRAPRGQRLRMSVPTAIGKRPPPSVRCRLTGMVAPMVLDGPINGRAFQAYRAGGRAGPPRPSRWRCGRLRPCLNPIENAFAKLKALLRKAAERTVEGLWTKIAELLPAFTCRECASYFATAGYDAT